MQKMKRSVIMNKKIGVFTCMLALLGMCCPVQAEAVSIDKTADQIMDSLREMSPMKRTDEWQIKPAEDGYYVSLLHLQNPDGLMVRNATQAELEEIAGDRKVYPLNTFLEQCDLLEQLDGKIRNPEHDALPAAYLEDDVFVIEFIYGAYPTEAEQSEIIESLIAHPNAELIGVLQTDWYVKGYYDDMATNLYIVPEEGYNVSAEELNTAEYGHLRYSPNLSDYVRGYLRDLPENTGLAILRDDEQSFDEIALLCEKLEAREDIAYAWISPVYLEDIKANSGDYGYTMLSLIDDVTHSETTTTPESTTTNTETTTQLVYTDAQLSETTETTVWADYTSVISSETTETTVWADYTSVISSETTETTVWADYTSTPESETTATSDSDLPQTGNNSLNQIAVILGALLMLSTGAWAVHSAGSLRHKDDET